MSNPKPTPEEFAALISIAWKEFETSFQNKSEADDLETQFTAAWSTAYLFFKAGKALIESKADREVNPWKMDPIPATLDDPSCESCGCAIRRAQWMNPVQTAHGPKRLCGYCTIHQRVVDTSVNEGVAGDRCYGCGHLLTTVPGWKEVRHGKNLFRMCHPCIKKSES